jgi:hypothetical protein
MEALSWDDGTKIFLIRLRMAGALRRSVRAVQHNRYYEAFDEN